MPIVTHKNQLPLPVREKYRFLAPDADTQDLPPDWYFNLIISSAHISNSTPRYMRICGMTAEILRGDRRLVETFPHKELQDYWSSRPRYEAGTSGGYGSKDSEAKASGSGLAQTLASEGNPNEPPPPPYTLEADDVPQKSPSPAHDEFQTAPTSPDPNDQNKYNVSDLATDLGRHTLGGPSLQSSSRSHIPSGPGPEPTSPSRGNLSQTPVRPPTGPPSPAFANRPSPPPQSATPLTTPPPAPSFFLPPLGAPQDIEAPSIPVPHVMPETSPHRQSINLNTPFHWDDDYPNPQPQPSGGFNVSTPFGPWDPPASTTPQETSFQSGYQSGYQPGYSSPPPLPQHSRPPIHSATKPGSPPKSPNEGKGALNTSPSFNNPVSSPTSGYNPPYPPPQSTYPGQVGSGSYYGYDQKMDGKGNDVWGGPPPSNSSYPGPATPVQAISPQSTYPGPATPVQAISSSQSTYPGSGPWHAQPVSYPGQTSSGPPPPSDSPSLPQSYGQYQS